MKFSGLVFILITFSLANFLECSGTPTISLSRVTIDTLACYATTKIGQSFTISWYKGDGMVSLKQYNKTKTETTIASLTLGRDAETTGTYTCVIKGPDGNATSDSVTVKRDTPYLQMSLPYPRPASLHLRIDERTSDVFYVTCIVTSFPKANVSFTRNGSPIQNGNNRIQTSSMEKGDTVTHTLSLKNASYLDAGEYICRASNGFKSGSITGNIIELTDNKCSDELLKTQQQYKCLNSTKCITRRACNTEEECTLYNCERPGTPKNPKIIRCTHDAAELQWTRDPKAITYTIYIDRPGHASMFLHTAESDVVAGGLQSNNEYTFTIVGTNNAGQSKETTRVKCRTTRLERPSRVATTKLHHHKDGITLGWDLPTDDGIRTDNVVGKLVYQVEYCPQMSRSYIEKAEKPSCKAYMTNHTTLQLKDVKAREVYKFSVSAINTGGMKSDPKIVYYTIPNYIPSHANGLTSNISMLMMLLSITILILKMSI